MIARECERQLVADERLVDDMIIVANAAARGVPLQWLARTVVARLQGGNVPDWRWR